MGDCCGKREDANTKEELDESSVPLKMVAEAAAMNEELDEALVPLNVDGPTKERLDEALVSLKLDEARAELSKPSGMNPNSVVKALKELEAAWAQVATVEPCTKQLRDTLEQFKMKLTEAAHKSFSLEAAVRERKLEGLRSLATAAEAAEDALLKHSGEIFDRVNFSQTLACEIANDALSRAEGELSKESGMNSVALLKGVQDMGAEWHNLGKSEAIFNITSRWKEVALKVSARMQESMLDAVKTGNGGKQRALLKFATNFDAACADFAGFSLKADMQAKQAMSTSSPSAVNNTSQQASLVSPPMQSRAAWYMGDEDLEAAGLKYTPLINFVNNPPPGHTTSSQVSVYVMNMEPYLPGIKYLREIVDECNKITASLQSSNAFDHIGDLSMMYAIVLYCFDLCLIKPPSIFAWENNFYYIFNSELRKRNTMFLKFSHGYLYFMMTGLARLPPASGTVYRGIGKEIAPAARRKFQQGVQVHFSAFSSTATEIKAAALFAGSSCLILRFKLLPSNSCSRDIHEFSIVLSFRYI